LTHTLHAEQAAITNAWNAGEERIEKLAVTYIPCALCRQFITELDGAKSIQIILESKEYSMAELLPYAFGPDDLGNDTRLMTPHSNNLMSKYNDSDELIIKAVDAADNSYSPYAQSYSGVALQTDDGAVITGRYAENIAFNISMNPMEGALSNLNLYNKSFSSISRAVIVEPEANQISQITAAKKILSSVNSNVSLEVVRI